MSNLVKLTDLENSLWRLPYSRLRASLAILSNIFQGIIYKPSKVFFTFSDALREALQVGKKEQTDQMAVLFVYRSFSLYRNASLLRVGCVIFIFLSALGTWSDI